jgi:hypothetical protein
MDDAFVSSVTKLSHAEYRVMQHARRRLLLRQRAFLLRDARYAAAERGAAPHGKGEQGEENGEPRQKLRKPRSNHQTSAAQQEQEEHAQRQELASAPVLKAIRKTMALSAAALVPLGGVLAATLAPETPLPLDGLAADTAERRVAVAAYWRDRVAPAVLLLLARGARQVGRCRTPQAGEGQRGKQKKDRSSSRHSKLVCTDGSNDQESMAASCSSWVPSLRPGETARPLDPRCLATWEPPQVRALFGSLLRATARGGGGVRGGGASAAWRCADAPRKASEGAVVAAEAAFAFGGIAVSRPVFDFCMERALLACCAERAFAVRGAVSSLVLRSEDADAAIAAAAAATVPRPHPPPLSVRGSLAAELWRGLAHGGPAGVFDTAALRAGNVERCWQEWRKAEWYADMTSLEAGDLCPPGAVDEEVSEGVHHAKAQAGIDGERARGGRVVDCGDAAERGAEAAAAAEKQLLSGGWGHDRVFVPELVAALTVACSATIEDKAAILFDAFALRCDSTAGKPAAAAPSAAVREEHDPWDSVSNGGEEDDDEGETAEPERCLTLSEMALLHAMLLKGAGRLLLVMPPVPPSGSSATETPAGTPTWTPAWTPAETPTEAPAGAQRAGKAVLTAAAAAASTAPPRRPPNPTPWLNDGFISPEEQMRMKSRAALSGPTPQHLAASLRVAESLAALQQEGLAMALDAFAFAGVGGPAVRAAEAAAAVADASSAAATAIAAAAAATAEADMQVHRVVSRRKSSIMLERMGQDFHRLQEEEEAARAADGAPVGMVAVGAVPGALELAACADEAVMRPRTSAKLVDSSDDDDDSPAAAAGRAMDGKESNGQGKKYGDGLATAAVDDCGLLTASQWARWVSFTAARVAREAESDFAAATRATKKGLRRVAKAKEAAAAAASAAFGAAASAAKAAVKAHEEAYMGVTATAAAVEVVDMTAKGQAKAMAKKVAAAKAAATSRENTRKEKAAAIAAGIAATAAAAQATKEAEDTQEDMPDTRACNALKAAKTALSALETRDRKRVLDGGTAAKQRERRVDAALGIGGIGSAQGGMSTEGRIAKEKAAARAAAASVKALSTAKAVAMRLKKVTTVAERRALEMEAGTAVAVAAEKARAAAEEGGASHEDRLQRIRARRAARMAEKAANAEPVTYVRSYAGMTGASSHKHKGAIDDEEEATRKRLEQQQLEQKQQQHHHHHHGHRKEGHSATEDPSEAKSRDAEAAAAKAAVEADREVREVLMHLCKEVDRRVSAAEVVRLRTARKQNLRGSWLQKAAAAHGQLRLARHMAACFSGHVAAEDEVEAAAAAPHSGGAPAQRVRGAAGFNVSLSSTVLQCVRSIEVSGGSKKACAVASVSVETCLGCTNGSGGSSRRAHLACRVAVWYRKRSDVGQASMQTQDDLSYAHQRASAMLLPEQHATLEVSPATASATLARHGLGTWAEALQRIGASKAADVLVAELILVSEPGSSALQLRFRE